MTMAYGYSRTGKRWMVASCRNCHITLHTGEGMYAQVYGRRRMVCRDEDGCAVRVAAYEQDRVQRDAQRDAEYAREQAATQAATVYAEYVREQERLAALRYVVTMHYDEHPTLGSRVVWEGTGFWMAARWAQSAAKSLIVTDADAYIEYNAENTVYSAYRRNWSQQGKSYILVGHASVAEEPQR